MKLIDTHTHLYLPEFYNDINEVIERASAAGVYKFFLPAIDSSETEALLQLERKFPGKCHAMAGLHPCSVKEDYKNELDKVLHLLQERNFAAIGETGLDFYWDKTFVKEQYESLAMQAEWALQFDVPLVLHTRNAVQETIDVIRPFSERGLTGIFHCFSGTLQQANEIIDINFYLGIGGVITYKNSGLGDIIKETGLANVVLETDAPYLTPAPFRGKRNESGYLKYVVEKIADIRKIAPEEAADITTRNAEKVFRKVLAGSV